MTGQATREHALPALWADGRCPRGHDVTDPANVRVVRRETRRADGGGARVCRACALERDRARRHGGRLESPIAFPDRVCEHCGDTYSRPSGVSRPEWQRRRYCGHPCRVAALVESARRRADVVRRAPLDEATVRRLRALVGVQPTDRPEAEETR
jgi:hypothetical protein